MTSFQRERERLARRLRELRQDARLTGRQLAAANGWPPSKITKIEHGKQTPSDADIEAWADACGNSHVIGDLIAALRVLDEHYLEKRRDFRSGRESAQRALAERESTCSMIRGFEGATVVGLLQTAEYARYILGPGAKRPGCEYDRDPTVAARMQRQQVLYRSDIKVHLLVTEATLRYRPCPPDVMLGQFDRLISATALETIRFGIIPFDTQYTAGMPAHGFWIYDDEEVQVETMTASLTLGEPSEVREYLERFAHYAEMAVYGAQARALILRAIGQLPPTGGKDGPYVPDR